ncbi:MAG TPA: enoyl-CoA hydratase-related protein [Acidimicrobiales bacterium]|nr:enoyl-CoA hydratase-related protein [Acidimicrobiales bacterium]
MSEAVLYEVDGAVATITLNRPEAMNTMNAALLEGKMEALETAAVDDSVRAVILTGTGRAFCAGGDLKGMAAGGGVGGGGRRRTLETEIGRLRANMRSSQLLHDMPKLTIAAINGACAGAGLAWACAADVRYCADTAVFNTAFMTAGLSGDFGGTWTLPRIVGPARARELYLMAEKFGADDAARYGLVTAVLPADQLMPYARERARRAAGFAPLTFANIKSNLNDSPDVSFSEMLDREAGRHIRSGATEDAREAAAAFLEKRPPVFKGR